MKATHLAGKHKNMKPSGNNSKSLKLADPEVRQTATHPATETGVNQKPKNPICWIEKFKGNDQCAQAIAHKVESKSFLSHDFS